MVREPEVPPTRAPRVPEYERPRPRVAEVVATFAKVFTPEKYGMLPTTAAVEVERPSKVRLGVVPPEEMRGQVPVTLVTPAAAEEVAIQLMPLVVLSQPRT